MSHNGVLACVCVWGGWGEGRRGTWHVAAGRRVVRAGRQRRLRAQHGALRLVEPLRAREHRRDDRRVAQLGGEAEGGRQAVGARLARVGAVERRKGGRVASKAGEEDLDVGRQASLLPIARGTGRLRGGRLGQQRLQSQRRAALGLVRIDGLDELAERVQVQLARAVAIELGKHLLRLRQVDFHALPPERLLQLLGVDVAAPVGVEHAIFASDALIDV